MCAREPRYNQYPKFVSGRLADGAYQRDLSICASNYPDHELRICLIYTIYLIYGKLSRVGRLKCRYLGFWCTQCTTILLYAPIENRTTAPTHVWRAACIVFLVSCGIVFDSIGKVKGLNQEHALVFAPGVWRRRGGEFKRTDEHFCALRCVEICPPFHVPGLWSRRDHCFDFHMCFFFVSFSCFFFFFFFVGRHVDL